jgi:hypothetical protein
MSIWFAIIDASPDVSAAVKRNFANSGLHFDELDGRTIISSPRFGLCNDRDDVAAAAHDLISGFTIALGVLDRRPIHIELIGLVEKEGERVNSIMFARGGAYGISGAAAVSSVGSIGQPVRTRAERLVALIERDDRVRDVGSTLAIKPTAWAALTKAYETITGLMSKKSDPQKARGDWKNLVSKGWLSEDEATAFYHTAAYHRKGYPKSPIRGGKQMPPDEASKLIHCLFEKLIDELEPGS